MEKGLYTSNRVLGGKERAKPRRCCWKREVTTRGGGGSRPKAFQGPGVSASTLWNVSPQLPRFGGTGLPWEPFRPWGLVSTGGRHSRRAPSGLGRLQGGRGRGAGWAGDSGSEERAAGKEAHLDFAVSSGPASSAGRAGTSPGVAEAVAGPGGSPATGHWSTPTFRHFRGKLMTALVSGTVSAFPTAWTPLACLGGRQTEGAGDPDRWTCVCKRVRDSSGCLGCHLSLPKKKSRKYTSRSTFHQNGVLLQRKT